MDLLSFLSQIRPVGLAPKCLRTRGQLEHPTTSQGVILTRPRARVLQNPTSHRVGILPTGQFGPNLKIDAQNIDLRTVRPGTRLPVVLNPGIVHRTGLYPGTGHRVGPHPGRTVVRLDKGHRDGHHGAILGTGQFGTGLGEGHPVLDLITDLIQGIVIRSVEGIDQEWRDTLDPEAINVITVRVQVLIRTRGLDQSARTGLPLLIDTGVIRRRRLTNVALLLSLETTKDVGTPGPRHKDRARALPSSSDRDDNLSISVDNNEFEGESRAGSPHKASSKLARKHLIDKGSSDSEEEEEVTISFAEAIQEVVSLLPPEICPRKESSETLQRPRSTLDALNPSENKSSASLPQSLLIKDVVNVFQSLIDKKVKLEPGWVTNKSLEKDLGINMKHYRSHGQLFHDSVPKLDRDASLLDLTSSGNVSLPLKSLETMERQARNMVSINSYADLFTAASVKALESDNLDAPMLKRLLSSIVTCLKHSSSMSVVLAVELLQARREAAIDKSKILTETTKSKLRSVPISAESLFGGKIAELQKFRLSAAEFHCFLCCTE